MTPLSGIRAVELASYITGPFAGQMLADLGAAPTETPLPPPMLGEHTDVILTELTSQERR